MLKELISLTIATESCIELVFDFFWPHAKLSCVCFVIIIKRSESRMVNMMLNFRWILLGNASIDLLSLSYSLIHSTSKLDEKTRLFSLYSNFYCIFLLERNLCYYRSDHLKSLCYDFLISVNNIKTPREDMAYKLVFIWLIPVCNPCKLHNYFNLLVSAK